MASTLPASQRVAVAPHAAALTRGRVLRWLRTAHVWLGLWGALLGFAFGLTGFMLNHRAVMKIPVERAEVTRAQISVLQPFENTQALADWLTTRAGLPDAHLNVRTEPASTVQWRGNPVLQPERWTINVSTPRVSVSAKYTAGSGMVDVETQDATLWGVLMRLHMGVGASSAWILLADSIAGAFMILTLSGVLLWSKLRVPRLLGIAALIGAPVLAALYVGAA